MAHTEKHLASQMGFLASAAHMLARTAPETSAYLLSQRNAVLLSHDLALPAAQREHVCGGCGHILIPGHDGDALRIETGEKHVAQRSKKDKKHGQHKQHKQQQQQQQQRKVPPSQSRLQRDNGPTKMFQCGTCPRYTRVELPAPGPIQRRRRQQGPVGARGTASAAAQDPKTKTTARQGQPEPRPVPSANLSSKKRAKSRKAGLQALLSQKDNETASRSGLSLADFLSK